MDNGQWLMDNGQWLMDNGQWSMVNGKWSMVNGQWSMVNGQNLVRWVLFALRMEVVSSPVFRAGFFCSYHDANRKKRFNGRLQSSHFVTCQNAQILIT
jgi:hypothetical protein